MNADVNMTRPGAPIQDARQRGLTLVELMIALTIGSIILLGLVGIASTASRDQGELTKAARQIDNARYALQVLQEDIKIAGYYGQYHADPAAPGALPDPCELTITDIDDGIGLPLQPYDATNVGVDCVDDDNWFEDTDILVVRRASSEITAPGALNANDVYIQSNISTFTINTGVAANFTLVTSEPVPQPAPIRKFVQHIYYVDCSLDGMTDCDGLDNTNLPANAIPTLKRLSLRASCVSGETAVDENGGGGITCPSTSGPFWVVEPIAEGVQNLQLDYGLDTDSSGTPNGVYDTDPALTSMDDIVAVRAFVLGRNRETSIGHTDNKTYNMGIVGNVGAFNDGFKRNNYNTTIQVVNTSTRRGT